MPFCTCHTRSGGASSWPTATLRPPALPGRQHKFDIYGGRASPKLLIVRHHALERKFDDGRVREPKPQQGERKYHAVFIPKCRRKTLRGVEAAPRGCGTAKGKPD